MNQSKEQMAENRILILYILQELGLPVTALHLTEILANRAFMDYFTQQETIADLLETAMLREDTEDTGRKYYRITEEGIAAVSTLITLLPAPIKHNFDLHKPQIREMVKRDWEINATQHIDERDNHYVRCFVRDGDSFLIDMKLLAGSKKLASEMCINWRKHTEQIYSKLIHQLLDTGSEE